MNNFFRHITAFGWATAIVLSLVPLCGWIPTILRFFPAALIACLLAAANAFFLTTTVYRAAVSRTLAGMPALCYLWLTAAVPTLLYDWQAQLAAACILFVINLLLSAWHLQDRAVENSFLATLLLALTALFTPDILLFIPFLWIALGIQRALTFRVWLASLTALILVGLYTFLCAHFLPTPYALASFSDILARGSLTTDIPSYHPAIQILPYAFVALIGFVFLIGAYSNFSRANVSVQSFILFLSAVFVLSAVLMCFPPATFSSLSALAVCGAAGLGTICMYERKTTFSGILFLVFLTLCALSRILSDPSIPFLVFP